MKMLNFTKLIVFLSMLCIVANAAPYQELQAKPGYVAVYIREGNTPLSQINTKLAEAFRENEESIHPQTKTGASTKTEAATSDGKKQSTENTPNGNGEEREGTVKLHEETGKPEQTISISDIAVFTNDDIRALPGDF